MSLPGFSVSRPVLTTMATLIVVTIGAVSLLRLPIDLMPEIELPTLTISTRYENASPEEIERLITEVIERAVAAVPGVEQVTSTSAESVGNVRVSFVWGTNLDVAANDIRERLDRVLHTLPDEADRPQLRKFDVAAMPIVFLGASSNLDPIELTHIIENQIQYRLERIPGVAAVDTWGGFTREIQVNLDAGRIRALDLPLNRVLDAIREANINVPAGVLDRGLYEVTLRTPGEYTSLEEIAQTVVAVREGGVIRLGEIAVIDDTHARITRVTRINGEPGVRLAVRKQAGSNTVEVANRVLAEIEHLNRDLPQVNLVPVINTAEYIERSIANVARSVLYGGSLAVLVLLVFLRNFRSTFVIALAIPISIIATFALVFFGGFTINLMTLGGLALGVGMMVDNSIVVLENIFRRREENGEASREAAVNGASEVAGAIIASTITTLVIFLPLAFVRGVSGILFQQLAYVIAFALICSLLVALSLVPVLSARVLRSPREMHEARPSWLDRIARVFERAFAAVEEAYRGLLRTVMRARLLTTAAAVMLLGASLLLIPYIGTEFMPPTDEGEVRVDAEMDVGMRLDVINEKMRMVERIVREATPEIENHVVSVGPSPWRPQAAATGQVRISLIPARQRSRSNIDIADDLRRRLDGAVPGMTVRTRAPQGQFLINRLLGGDESIAVEVRGFDLATLDALSREVQRAVIDVPGVTDIRVSREAGVPQELVRIDREKAADLGLTVRQVATSLETALAGSRAGEYREAGNEFRILVKIRDAEQLSLEEILDLTLANDAGESVALRNVVDLEDGTGPVFIDRKDQQRIAQVSVNITGRDLGSVAADIQDVLRDIPRPAGYEFIIAGDYEEQQKAFNELIISLVLSLLLVYMVLASQYESLRDPLVVMCTTPMAAIGVLVTLLLTGTTLNVQSYIGCIMLGGIVVNNAILLVDQAGRLRREGLTVADAVVEAGRRRLRPILMTTLTTVLGLMPLALGFGEGAEAQAPLARAVVGGLLGSTLITLVLIPAVYALVHPEKETQTVEAALLRVSPA